MAVDVQENCDRDPTQIGSPHANMRRDVKSERERLPKVTTSRDQAKPIRNISKGENINSLARQARLTPNQEYQDCPMASLRRLRQGDGCIQPECGPGSQSNDTGHGDALVESTWDAETGSAPLPRGCFHSTTDNSGPVEAINNTGYHDTRTGGPIQNGNLERTENVSKITMVDNLSSMEMSPDDVVELIGQKHFWKARRAIVK